MIVFSGAELDRAPGARAGPDWLAERRADPRARTLQLSERGVWIEAGRLLLGAPDDSGLFLGLADGAPLFASDVSAAEPAAGHAAGLREAATELPAAEAALAAYAASLLSWHRRHGFCANCGAATEIADAGHERRCPRCQAHHFPRTDPVVIVRVVDGGDRLLLGRSPRWPAGATRCSPASSSRARRSRTRSGARSRRSPASRSPARRTWPRSRGPSRAR